MLASTLLLNSCDFCTGVQSGGNPYDEEVYFSATPENGDFPNVYSVSPDGLEIENRITNAVTYSAPSNSGRVCFIRSEADSPDKHLYIADYNGANQRLIASDNDLFSISHPMLSIDSKHIVFNAGSGRLFYQNAESGSVFTQVTSKLSEGTAASFSPDSKLIATIETDDNINKIIKIYSTQNSDFSNPIYSKNFGPVTFVTSNFAQINWSFDSELIVFTISNSNQDIVKVINIFSGEERTIEIPNAEIGGRDASLSPNNDFIAISGKDGNIWIIHIANNDLRFSKITDASGFELNDSPKWSFKGNKILYLSRSKFDGSEESTLISAEIEITNVLAKSNKINVLSNNVILGFWKKNNL